MKLTFRIQYRTVWGEYLCALVNSEVIELSTKDGINWQGTAECRLPQEDSLIAYRYGVYRDGICVRKECGAIPHLFCPGNAQQTHAIFR